MAEATAEAGEPPVTLLGVVAACWATIGLCALLLYAIVRLSMVVADGAADPWDWRHWAVAAANAAFMAWSEGYRGFQLRFSPRSAARVKWLVYHASGVSAVLAPLFAMGYFNATRRRLLGVYGLTAFVVGAIVFVHALPQPWRAVLDIGVIIGLAWGIASFLWSLKRTFTAAGFPVSPELAETGPPLPRSRLKTAP